MKHPLRYGSEAVRRAPLLCFFSLTILFTWSLLPLAATSIFFSLVTLCGPAVAAFIVTAIEDRESLLEFHARLTHWRFQLYWYLFALTLPVLILAIRSGVEYAWGAHGVVEFQPLSPLSLIVFVLVAGEEIGWRGFALPRLLSSFGPWSASAILGILWAFWHFPLFSIPAMPQYETPYFAFVVYTIALSVILTYLTWKSRESVILATSFHGAVNTFGIVNTAATPALRGWSNALCYGLTALLIGMATWKPTSNLTPSNFSRPELPKS